MRNATVKKAIKPGFTITGTEVEYADLKYPNESVNGGNFEKMLC